MKNPSIIKTNMLKTELSLFFKPAVLYYHYSMTINGITIPVITLDTKNHLLIIPFPLPNIHFCHFILQNAPSLPFYSHIFSVISS